MFLNRIKGKLAEAYVKYLIEKTEDINIPGFIVTKLTGNSSELLLRDVFLPEDLFVKIEDSLVREYGEKGQQVLYSAGKKGGHAYAALSNFTRKSQVSIAEFEAFGWILMEFIGGTYASDVEIDLNTSQKRLEIRFKDFVICEKNGKGYFMTEGGIAGIWSYLIEDPTIEAIQLNCQGRGEKECHILIQPRQNFTTPIIYNVTDLPVLTYSDEYQLYNKIHKTEYITLTLNELIQDQFGEYSNGKILIKKIRYFEFDPTILYILEQEISSMPGGEKILFEVAYETGKNVLNSLSNPSIQLIMDFMGVLGWGETIILENGDNYNINIRYFPWTPYSVNSRYIIFRGWLSGMLSQLTGKDIRLNNFESSYIENYLSIILNA